MQFTKLMTTKEEKEPKTKSEAAASKGQKLTLELGQEINRCTMLRFPFTLEADSHPHDTAAQQLNSLCTNQG